MIRLAAAGLSGRQRSFRGDCAAALRAVPPIRVEGREHIPSRGPFLAVINHYNAPGIGVWWPVMALSAALPTEPHWVMTLAWTYTDWLRRHTFEPLSAWAFTRVARVYGFTTMPPMPPRPGEEIDRALALRKVFRFIRSNPGAIVGLAPEGHNTPDLSLGWPPPGGGKFMLRLAQRLGRVLPAGTFLEEGELVVRFGPPFCLALPPGSDPAEVDRLGARIVMEHIAPLVPEWMQGEFK